MDHRKILNLALALVVIASLLVSTGGAISGGGARPGRGLIGDRAPGHAGRARSPWPPRRLVPTG